MSRELIIIAEGILAGMIISIPKGPAGFFIVKQTISYGTKKGMTVALGCILTTILVSAAVLFPVITSLKSVLDFMADLFHKIPLVIAVIIVIVGIVVYKIEHVKDEELTMYQAVQKSLNLFLYTIIDPTTTIQTLLVFVNVARLSAWFGLKAINICNQSDSDKMLFLYAVIAGSVLWYGMTALIIKKYCQTQTPNLEKFNKFVGLTFIASGFIIVVNTLK